MPYREAPRWLQQLSGVNLTRGQREAQNQTLLAQGGRIRELTLELEEWSEKLVDGQSYQVFIDGIEQETKSYREAVAEGNKVKASFHLNYLVERLVACAEFDKRYDEMKRLTVGLITENFPEGVEEVGAGQGKERGVENEESGDGGQDFDGYGIAIGDSGARDGEKAEGTDEAVENDSYDHHEDGSTDGEASKGCQMPYLYAGRMLGDIDDWPQCVVFLINAGKDSSFRHGANGWYGVG